MIMELAPLPKKTPYERGHEDGLLGKAGPAFPTPDSDWSARLYNRGWEAGVSERKRMAS
jgi:hypothetical protein